MTRSTANRAAVVAGLAVVAAVAAVAVAAGASDSIRVLDLSRDPATLSGAPAHDGLLTNLGAFVWSATVTLCVFGGWIVHRDGGLRSRVGFLWWSAAVTSVLMIDDIFLIHERAAPALGFAEEPLFVFYAVAVGALLVVHRGVLVDTRWPVLALALLVFAIALARNRLFDVPAGLLPDTLAFVGTGLWMVFHLHTTIDWVEQGRQDVDHSPS